MTYTEAASYINANPQQYLQADKHGGYICPICHSGSGKHGTGITENKNLPGRFTCWAGSCFANATVTDILALQEGISDISASNFRAVVEAASRAAGITLENDNDYKTKAHSTFVSHSHKANAGTQSAKLTPLPVEYVNRCCQSVKDTDYWQKRGISPKTLANFPNIGYDSHFHAGGGKYWQAVMFFTSESSYEARNTDIKAVGNNRHRKTAGSPIQIFNRQALQESEPVFVTESIFDALSIIEVGGQAIGIGGTSGVSLLVQAIKEEPVSALRLLFALDNDEAGSMATSKALDKLHEIGYPCESVANLLYNDVKGKDPNEALVQSRESFANNVQKAIELAKEHAEAEKMAEQEEYLQTCVSAMIGDFALEIERQQDFFPTGFTHLDRMLDGGLYAGIYTLGAISSLGKTTFCLQIADNIAKCGGDVLIFSLEMSKYELMAKSISRHSYWASRTSKDYEAATTRDILSNRYRRSIKQKEAILEAIAQYGEYGDHIFIKEGIGNLGVSDIREAVRLHIRKMRRKPVVLIDYLQILAPPEPHLTDKQATDKNILELKRLSRDENIPIIGISSFNRENYNSPINLASFKESGAIEYSSDVLLGLQHYGMDFKTDGEGKAETDNTRAKRIRELREEIRLRETCGEPIAVELKVLKNRNGCKGRSIFNFFPAYNVFVEAEPTNSVSTGHDGVMPPRRSGRKGKISKGS